MAQITEDYVGFETAKLLKKKGFDEVCYRIYDTKEEELLGTDGIMFQNHEADEESIIAPTLQMAIKWLREVHNILIVVDYEWECDTTPYYFKIYRLDENGKPKQVPVKGVSYDKDDNPTEHIIGYRDWERSLKDFSSHEEACEAAIKYCLENLIVK